LIHSDHVNLIKKGISGQTWADFGSGTGAFTLALADILGTGSEIYSIDKDRRALKEQSRLMEDKFPGARAAYIEADFRKAIDLPPLDGALMANSLHFVRRKEPVLALMRSYLKPGGKLVIVEYNTDRGNVWVPHPFSYPTWEKMAAEAGFNKTEKIGAYPSRFLQEIYGAVATAPS
jgi:ubiquinone/menaquinone biosynthesis C-methylase UbiE